MMVSSVYQMFHNTVLHVEMYYIYCEQLKWTLPPLKFDTGTVNYILQFPNKQVHWMAWLYYVCYSITLGQMERYVLTWGVQSPPELSFPVKMATVAQVGIYAEQTKLVSTVLYYRSSCTDNYRPCTGKPRKLYRKSNLQIKWSCWL